MESKECTKCKIEKSLEHFTKRKASKDGFTTFCKLCLSKEAANYRKQNRKTMVNISKKYREKNPDKVKESMVKYKKYNSHKIVERSKIWRKNNKNQFNSQQRDKWSKDKLYRLKCNMRCLIRYTLKTKKVKKDRTTSKMIGCTYEELLNHLNNNLYGFVYGDDELDIDHIIPSSSAETEEELIKLNHYTNLQILPTEYNRYIKRDKLFNKNHFEEWLAIKFKL